MTIFPDHARAWLAQWQAAGPALAAQRRRELRAMSDAEALAAAEAVLALAAPLEPGTRRLTTSGLIQFQQWLRRR